MRAKRTTAELYLNDLHVGTVHVMGWESSWGMGEFQPNDGFSRFAPLFGVWSLLMHADDEGARMSSEASEELRRVEYEIDRLRARLHFVETDEWRDVGPVNIDGKLVEWKER